jgi:hypothetical protein
MANWDIRSWLYGMSPEEGGVTSHNFRGYTFDMVFQYEYAKMNKRNGCVKMTYKDRLSTKGTSKEAEWLPIERVEQRGI